MSGILYINQDFLSAGRICRSLWKEFDISLCTHYREANDWIRDLDPAVILVHYDPAIPQLAQFLVHFLEKDDRHRLVAIHARACMESDREEIRRTPNHDSVAYRLFHVDEDLPSIRQALKTIDSPRQATAGAGALQGVSLAIRSVNDILEKYASSDFPVLIVGESGTGKELAARRIHEASARGKFEMVALDCGAFPDQLTESILFGSEKGAFTDAVERSGVLDEAAGSTLFLDEIGNLTLSGQSKFLRVLETGDFRRLGGKKNRKAEFRLVSATSLDLRKAIRDGRFRDDLYYRVNTLILTIPPLRSRPEDIEALAVFLCLKHSGGSCIPGREAIDKLLGHDWPGNVRELKNTIQRAIVLGDSSGELGVDEIIFS
jgi:transcriptional regulator with PAS, ATPase and Fis domain